MQYASRHHRIGLSVSQSVHSYVHSCCLCCVVKVCVCMCVSVCGRGSVVHMYMYMHRCTQNTDILNHCLIPTIHWDCTYHMDHSIKKRSIFLPVSVHVHFFTILVNVEYLPPPDTNTQTDKNDIVHRILE